MPKTPIKETLTTPMIRARRLFTDFKMVRTVVAATTKMTQASVSANQRHKFVVSEYIFGDSITQGHQSPLRTRATSCRLLAGTIGKPPACAFQELVPDFGVHRIWWLDAGEGGQETVDGEASHCRSRFD